MGWMRRIGNLFLKQRVDAEIEAELRAHLEMAVEDGVRAGMSEDEARRAARLRFGNPVVVRERTVGADAALWLDGLWRDLKYALRQMGKSPGFAATVVLTLALGIGATTAVFTLVHSILLSRLPFKDPNRVLSVKNAESAGLGYDFQAKDMEASFRHEVGRFSTLESGALYSTTGANVALRGEQARRLQAAETSAQFFRVLGVSPMLGRGFAANEDVEGRDHVVLISNRLWRGAFHADPGVVGRTIRVDGFAFEVIGVMPPHVNFPEGTDLWVPTIFDPHASLVEAGAFFTPMIVRVRQGVSIGAARAELQAHWMQTRKTDATAQRPVLIPIASELTKAIRSSLLLLGGAVGFVLLIACANVSCLVLVRASERRGELAVRAALGAARGALIRQRVVETMLLSMLSGGLGFVLAEEILRLLYVFRPAVLAQFARPHLDVAMFGFTAGMALLVGGAVGLVPAVTAGRGDPTAALKRGVWRTVGAGNGFRRVLVAGEIALTFVLLTGTGLLIHTMVNLDRVPLGYSVRNILTFSTSLNQAQTVGKGARHRDAMFYSAVLERLAAIPGVEAVGAASEAPLSKRAQMLLPVSREGDHGKPVSALLRVVSGEYFDAMGVSLVEGRSFSQEDDATSRRVAIVSEDLANRLWPGENPIGRQLHCSWMCHPSAEVVGVVRANRSLGARSKAMPEYFLPYTQQEWPFMTFVMRVRGNPASYAGLARGAVTAVDPSQPIYGVRTMRQRLNDSESSTRFEAFALTSFASVSLVLVVIGLYGILAYRVTQRFREIGLRIALGASRGAIQLAFVREAAVLTMMGVLAGLGASLALGHLLSAALFGIAADDPWTLCGATLLFVLVALIAAWVPARRAAGVDPMRVLRME